MIRFLTRYPTPVPTSGMTAISGSVVVYMRPYAKLLSSCTSVAVESLETKFGKRCIYYPGWYSLDR